MTTTTSIASKYAINLKQARKYAGTALSPAETIMIAGVVQKTPSKANKLLGLKALGNRYLILTPERLILLTGRFVYNRVDQEWPVSSIETVWFSNSVVAIQMKQEVLALQFFTITGDLPQDLLACFMELGKPVCPTLSR